jgi:putative ABC transport system substrate-binding protein
MRRRPIVAAASVALAALASPAVSPVLAQAAGGRQVRVGVLGRLPPTAPEAKHYWDPFVDELAARGWVPERNVEFIVRATMGRNEQASALADELAAAKVDLIVSVGTLLTQAARKAAPKIPIVAVNVVYPVQARLVDSLARPGGNVTGVATMTTDLAAKNFELVRELLPQAHRVGVIWNPSSPTAMLAFDEQQAAAVRLGLALVSLPIDGPNDIDAALAIALRERVQVLAVHPNPAWWPRLPAAWGIEHRVAIISPPEQGYLFDIGPDWDEVMRIAASQVDRVLRGDAPATLPMQQPTRFALTLNMKTAHALALTVPPSVRLRATKLID